MLPEGVVELLNKNIVKEHGVVNVRAVIEELDRQKEDPASSFEQLLKDPVRSEWHFYGLEGMRFLAVSGRIVKHEQAQLILDTTGGLAQQLGMDEYYKSIRAIALSPNVEIAKIVLNFAAQRLKKQDLREWRWLAFFTVGTFLQRETNLIPSELAYQLKDEAGKEPEEKRKVQLSEIANLAINRTIKRI